MRRVSSNSALLTPFLSPSSDAAWPRLCISPLSNPLLCSRRSSLQEVAARLGMAPNQVGGIKLMALQVRSMQLKLLPRPSSAHPGSLFSEPVMPHPLFLPISLACVPPGSTFSHWGAWHRSRMGQGREGGSLHPLTVPMALGSWEAVVRSQAGIVQDLELGLRHSVPVPLSVASLLCEGDKMCSTLPPSRPSWKVDVFAVCPCCHIT